MRQQRILTRTLLILSILNFALAAPVAVRLDASVKRNVTIASQKRRGSDGAEELPLPNTPGSHHTPPPSPDLTDTSQVTGQLAEQHVSTDSPQPPPNSLGSSTGPRLPVAGTSLLHPPESGPPKVPGSDHAPPQSAVLADVMSQIAEQLGYRQAGSWQPPPVRLGSSTGSRLQVGSSQPDPSRYRIQRPPVFKVPGNRPTLPQSQGTDLEKDFLLNSKPFADKLWNKVLMESGILGSLLLIRPPSPLNPPFLHPGQSGPSVISVEPEPSSSKLSTGTQPALLGVDPETHSSSPSPHSGQSGSSDDRIPSPSGIPVNPEPLSPTGSTGTQTSLPGVDSETHPSSPPNSELSPTEVLDKVLKGKVKRRISSSDVASLAQKETRSRRSPGL